MSDNAAVPEQTTHEQNIERLAPAMYSAIQALVYARMESTDAFRRASYSSAVQEVFNAVMIEDGHPRAAR